MKRGILLIPLLAVVSAVVLLAPAASAKAAGPTAGTKLVGDLKNPRGMKLGPDGMIYIAEAGTGGTTAVGSGDTASNSGNTGRISKVDPNTGVRTTVADNLPSNAGPEGDSVGPADVAFIGSQLYYVQTHGGAAFGFPSTPTGVYKVNSNGTTALVADIGTFNINNPVADVSSGTQQDIEPGGNPYSMTVRDGAFLVVDGNQNQVMKITTAGAITRLTEFPGHPVTTGIAYPANGPLYVAALGQFPFTPANGKVYGVSYPGGTASVVASGVSALTGIAAASNGNIYVSSFGDQATDPNGPPLLPFTGKVLRVNSSNGTLTPIVDGFTFTTALLFSGDTLYVTNNGINALGPGEIWMIPNFSTLQPLPPTPTVAPPAPTAPPAAPTATPPSGAAAPISAPNTGTGPTAREGDLRIGFAALALGILGLTTVARAIARKRG